MALAQYLSDSFARGTTTTGAAGSTTGVGNGWIDRVGGAFYLTSGVLEDTSAPTDYTSKWLTRPTSENSLVQRAVWTLAPLGTAQTAACALLRVDSANDNAYAAYLDQNGNLNLATFLNGVNANLANGAVPGYSATTSYVIDFKATPNASAGTDLTATVYAVSAPTTALKTLTVSGNMTAGLQAAGSYGFSSSSNSPGVTQAVLYNNSGVASLALSPSTVSAGAANVVVAITGTGTSFSGSPFAIAGGYGAYLDAQSVAGATSGAITLNPGVVGYGNLTVTDSGSGATAALTVAAPNLGPLGLGFIGDSITAGTNGDPASAMAAYLAAQGYTVTKTNEGQSGSCTADWLPGAASGYLAAALAAFAAAGTTIVQVMLGTNDTRTPYNFTVAQHASNMRLIVKALRIAGLQVLIHKPIWSKPNALFNGPLWANDPNTLYRQFWQANLSMVDGETVFAGDTGAYEVSALNPSTFLASDGIHPANATQNTTLGQLWAVAFLHRYGPLGTITDPAAHA